MTATTIHTFATIIARYAEDIAFVAEEAPASDVGGFVAQLQTAGQRLFDAGIHGAEDLETAATYLADAARAEGDRRRVLLEQAAKHLRGVDDMVEDYRLMV